MNIFLSGKVDAEHGSWRDAILREVYDYETRQRHPAWEWPVSYAMEPGTYPKWPVLQGVVLDLHNYCGPFRVTNLDKTSDSSNEGYFHGNTWGGSHGVMFEEDQGAIVEQCKQGIARADLIFAYINSPDCFGTIAELGLAHALGKYVNLVIDDGADWEWDDYWFVQNLVTRNDRQPRVRWIVGQDEPEAIDEKTYILERFKDALIHWTARPQHQARGLPLALHPLTSSDRSMANEAMRTLRAAEQSFAQIARWTSDPRVRAEAERMQRVVAS